MILCSLAQLHAQDKTPPKNLMYAAENLVFEDILAIGNYKLLLISPERQENKRFVYLLNKENLVVDTMKVYGYERYLIRNDTSLSIRGLNESVDITISKSSLKATSGFETKSKFTNGVIRPLFVFDKRLFGSFYLPEKDYSVYNWIPFKQIQTNAYVENKLNEYNFYQLDTLMILDEETTFLKDGVVIRNGDLIKPVLNEVELGPERIKSPYYGWGSYSLTGKNFFMYERDRGTIYQLDVDNDFALLNSLQLPIKDNKIEGWKYLFDYTKKEHYAVKRIKQVNEEEATSKRKKRKQEVTYEYVLYQLDFNKNTIKPLFKLGFDPKMVDNALVYEIVQESKKGSAIFFHPLDPNYDYKKTVFLEY
jgi:hypothetical protein